MRECSLAGFGGSGTCSGGSGAGSGVSSCGPVLSLGGVGMCFYTSYQLSMLAFTCVTPIIYLWNLYGSYSKRLNRLMLMALSEANSVATQALSSISTVKACSMEDTEIEKCVHVRCLGEERGREVCVCMCVYVCVCCGWVNGTP